MSTICSSYIRQENTTARQPASRYAEQFIIAKSLTNCNRSDGDIVLTRKWDVFVINLQGEPVFVHHFPKGS
jgi:hypothetical protein